MANRDVNFRLRGEDQTGSATKAAAGHFSALGGAINQANSAGGNATGVFGSLGGALGNMATVAGGIISAQIFTRIADGIGSFVSTGLNAVGSAQQLESSLKSLLTANNMYAQSVETLSVATNQTPEELAEQAQKLNDLKLARQTDIAAIQEQKQRIIELTSAYGDNGLNVQTARARLAEMENQVVKTDSEIARLSNTTTEYTDVTKTSWNQVMEMGAAQKLAAAQTGELMDAISKLAVVSPFETEQVEKVAKFAVGAGMGVKATEDFTAAFLDMAASVGIGSESLDFAADQLLQVKKIGKLTTIDLRQLRRMGIDLEKIIGIEMGMSIEEFNKKAETTPEIFDELFASLTRFSQNTFAGTSKEMAQSVKGIQSTLSDVFTIGAREFFRPLVDAVSPAVNDIVGKLSDMVLGGGMKDLGKQAAEMMNKGLIIGRVLLGAFERGGLSGLGQAIANMLASVWPDIQAALQGWATGIANELLAAWPGIQASLQEWANKFWGWVLDLYPQIPGILTGITQGIATFLTDNWPTISEALMEWTVKFWDWVKVAAAGAAGALIALGAAIAAWATSSEAQTSMNELGQNLGKMITDAMSMGFVGGEGATNALLALATGLVVAAASITGSLIILGGQLVAGILDGILTSLGVDLEPATFNELSGILSGIGSNIKTIASYVGSSIVTGIKTGWDDTVETITEAFTAGVDSWKKIITETEWAELGENIIKGILKGINDNVSKVFEVIKSMAGTAISEALAAFGVQSPSTVFDEIGRQLVLGLVQGVSGAAPNFQAALDQLFNLKHIDTGFGAAIGQANDDFEKALDEWMPEAKTKFVMGAFKKALRDNLDFATTATNDQLKELLLGSVSNWEAAGIRNVDAAVGKFIAIFREAQTTLGQEAQAAAAENFQKMLGGIGQFAGAATQEADNLNKRITILNSLLRQGGDAFNVEGQIMNAAQAQARLNQLVAEQAGMQGALSGITGFQAGLQGFQERQDLLGLLGAPTDAAAGDVIRGLEQLTGFLGQQIMAGLGQQLGVPAMPAGGTGVGGGMAGGDTTVVNFSPTINTTANEQSILQLFYTMLSMVPSGT